MIRWPTSGGGWPASPWLIYRRLPKMKNKPSRAWLVQFGKYMSGGVIYFWIGYGVFALCYSVFHLWWLWAKMIADAIGWTLNYLVQRYWAFNSDHLRLSEMQHVGRYIFIESIGFIL